MRTRRERDGDAGDAHGNGAGPAWAALLASVPDCVETTGDAVCAGEGNGVNGVQLLWWYQL